MRGASRPVRGRRRRCRTDPTGQAVHRVLPLSPQLAWRERRDCPDGASAGCPRFPPGFAKGRLPSLAALGFEQEVANPPPGGEAAARRALDRFLDSPVRDYADNHDALGRDLTSRLSPYLHFGCLSPRQIEEPAAARQGGGGVPAAALLARLLPPRPAPPPAEREVRVPGPLPRQDQVELRAAPIRGVVRGPDRIPAGGCGNAPAPAGGLDAQPRAPRRRLVPDQGPRNRLALGRALVHADAGRRRRGQQQRELAMDRLGGGRSPAPVPPHLQPHPPHGALRPERGLRPAVRLRASRRARRASPGAVADAR